MYYLRSCMESVRMRRLAAFMAVLLTVSTLVPAGEAPDEDEHGERISPKHKTALIKRIDALEHRYRELLLTGQDDATMKSAINQVGEAQRASDWAEVRKLLDSYESPVVESQGVKEGGSSAGTASSEVAIEERKVSYKSGNLVLSALVYEPSALDKQPPFPGVLFVHNNFLGAGLNERTLAREIASKLYVVMLVNLRGYGRNPGKTKYATDEVEDTIAALGALKAFEDVDAEKIALIGDRHGANCVLLAAARVGSAVSLVIAGNPYPNLGDALKKRGFRQFLSQVGVRISRHNTGEIIPRSPFYNVSGITAQVFIFYGKRNSVVSPKDMTRFLAVLGGRKVKAELKEFYTVGEELCEKVDIVKSDIIQVLEDKFRPRTRKRGSRRPSRRGN